MSDAGLPRTERFALATLVWRFPVIHLVIGLIGNILFVAGSALYMTEREDLGVLCFLTGSVGMLLGGLGEAMRILGKHRLAKFDIDPYDPDARWSQAQRPSSPLD